MNSYRLGAVLPLVIINAVMFMIQISVTGFTENFMLISADIPERPWIVLTSMFLHGSPTHLFFNMYALLMFGSLIEQKIGTKRFLFAYFLSGLLAATLPEFGAALGASGALMGIIGLTIIFFPHMKVLLFFFIPMSMRTAGIIFVLFDVFGAFSPVSTGIAHWAHLVGLVTGLFYGAYLIQKGMKFQKTFATPVDKHTSSDKYESSIELSNEDIDNYIKYGRL